MASQTSPLGLPITELRNIEKYELKVENLKIAKNKITQNESTQFKTHLFFIFSLAVITACSAYSIATSGGAGLAFYGGSGLGLASFMAMIWMAWIVAHGNPELDQEKRNIEIQLKDRIGNPEIYEALESLTDQEVVQGIVNLMEGECYKGFVQHVIHARLKGVETFSPEECRILNSLALHDEFFKLDAVEQENIANRISQVDVCSSLAASSRFKDVNHSAQRIIFETITQEEVNKAVSEISITDFLFHVTHAINNPQQFPKTLAAVSASKRVEKLSDKRLLLEKMPPDETKSRVAELSENEFVNFATAALEHYDSSNSNTVVIEALASSQNTKHLTCEYQLKLIEKLGENHELAKQIVRSCLNYRDLLNRAKTTYDKTPPAIVIKALSSWEYALSPEDLRWLMDRSGDKVSFVKGLNKMSYTSLVSSTLNEYVESKNQDVLNAFALSEFVLCLEENLLLLLENVNKETIDEMNPVRYKILINIILSHSDSPPAQVLAILTATKHTAVLEPSKLLLLMKRAQADQQTTKDMIGRLNEEQYKECVLAATTLFPELASQSVFNALKELDFMSVLPPEQQQAIKSPYNLRVLLEDSTNAEEIIARLEDEELNALANEIQKSKSKKLFREIVIYANRLDKKQIFDLLRAFGIKGNSLLFDLKKEKYNELVKYTFLQPKNKSVLKVLVLRIRDFAPLLLEGDFARKPTRESIAQMNDIQKACCLEITADSREIISDIFHETFDLPFAESFLFPIDSDRDALLKQLVRWPELIGNQIFLKQMLGLQYQKMLNALWQYMSESEKEICVNTLASKLIETEAAVNRLMNMINIKEYTGLFPDMILRAWGKKPAFFAYVTFQMGANPSQFAHVVEYMMHVKDKPRYFEVLHNKLRSTHYKLATAVLQKAFGLEGEARNQFYTQSCIKDLLSYDKFGYLVVDNKGVSENEIERHMFALGFAKIWEKEFLLNFYKGENGLYKKLATSVLQKACGLQAKDERDQFFIQTDLGNLLNKLTPDEFRDLVVAEREHGFVLDILEHMGEDASTYIQELDSSIKSKFFGHANFENMVKILDDEITNILANNAVVPVNRLKLYEQFSREELRGRVNGGFGWENFDRIKPN